MRPNKHHKKADAHMTLSDARHLARELRQTEKKRMAVVSDRQNGYTVINDAFAKHKNMTIVWSTKH